MISAFFFFSGSDCDLRYLLYFPRGSHDTFCEPSASAPFLPHFAGRKLPCQMSSVSPIHGADFRFPCRLSGLVPPSAISAPIHVMLTVLWFAADVSFPFESATALLSVSVSTTETVCSLLPPRGHHPCRSLRTSFPVARRTPSSSLTVQFLPPRFLLISVLVPVVLCNSARFWLMAFAPPFCFPGSIFVPTL